MIYLIRNNWCNSARHKVSLIIFNGGVNGVHSGGEPPRRGKISPVVLSALIFYNLIMLKRLKKVYRYELPLKIEAQKGGGFLAKCSIWLDCYAQGDSVDEAVLEATAVAQSLIELYKEEGLKIPLKLPGEKGISDPITIPVIVSA